MNMLVDLIFIAIIGFSAFKYYRSGLIGSVLGLGKLLISVIAACIFGKLIGTALAEGIIGESITQSVFNKITSYVDGKDLSEFFNNIPKGFLSFIKLLGADISSLEAKYGTEDASDAVLWDMARSLAMPLSRSVSAIVAYISVFLLAYIGTTVAVFLIKQIKIPIITSIDKYLGLGLGIIFGLLVSSLIATVIYSFAELSAAVSDNGTMMNVYNDSLIFKFIYDLRIFEFIRKLIK